MPLAIALLNVSNPTLGAMDALSRLSHDTDVEVAQNAVVSLGMSPVSRIFCPVSMCTDLLMALIPKSLRKELLRG